MAQWIIVRPSLEDTGADSRTERIAAETLAALIRRYADPACTRPVGILSSDDARGLLSSCHAVLIGVGNSNPLALHEGSAPAKPEEYTISVTSVPEEAGEELTRITITGSDAGGLLYGVSDFIGKVLPSAEYSGSHQNPYYLRRLFRDPMPPCRITSSPAVKNRGLWTWGHVIWDYRGLIDNMVRAKLNMLVIWNRFVPTNIREVIAYAHDRAVKVVLGYAWGWGTDNSYGSVKKILAERDSVAEEYFRDYAPLGADGIYFQSFTETSSETAGEIVIAEAVTDYVNHIAGRIFEKQPDLLLQFGLHASSVREKLDYLKDVDPRVTIVWEDCGAFPFAYTPDDRRTAGFDRTMALTEEIGRLRGDSERFGNERFGSERFGAVLKGLCCLNWDEFRFPEFPSAIGCADPEFLRRRTEEKRRIWKYVQAEWLKNADYARRAVRLMTKQHRGDLTLLALAEDSMFECEAWFPVMLLAEMLWDGESPTDELIRQTARSPFVVMA